MFDGPLEGLTQLEGLGAFFLGAFFFFAGDLLDGFNVFFCLSGGFAAF